MTTARFISPFMAHGNIEEYLDNTHSLVTDALRTKLLTDVLNGLVYLHSSSPPICHADIKPGNVLITDRVEAVLCDFGLARFVDGQPSGLTTTKTTKGSIRYMSPELLDGDPRHTLCSDVWAYGCLVLKVMTGSLPYSSRRSDQQVLLALALRQPPASPPDLELQDEMLKILLTKCWDINPSERPPASTCLSYLNKPIPDELQLQGLGKVGTASETRQLGSGSVLVEDAVVQPPPPPPQEASALTSGEQPAVILRVQVVGCADLLAKGKGGTSNPFVVVKLGRERYSTPVVKLSFNPEYAAEKATFDFPIYRSGVGYLGALELVVWDKALLRKDCIGEAAILFDEWFKHHEPSPAFAFDDPRNKPFPTPVVSSGKNTQAQGTIQVKIGFVPIDPASPPNYAAMFFEFQQLAKMTGPTLHSSVPTRGIGTTLVGESEIEDDGLSSAEEDSGDEMEEGTTPESGTSTSPTPMSSTLGSRKNAQTPRTITPSASQSLKLPSTSHGFLPKVLSLGLRSATSGKEDFKGVRTPEGFRPAGRTGKKMPSFKKQFDSNFNFSSNNDTVGIVMLQIQGAEDLPKLKNMTRTGWDMDPFCVISFGKKVFRTRVVRHSLDPVWDEKLLFHVHRYETNFRVNFSVLDWDKLSSNNNIGSVSFALSELMASVPKPDPDTMIYPESVAAGEYDMTIYKLPIVTDKNASWESKHAPVLKFRHEFPLMARRVSIADSPISRSAKYQPYRALRQRFWREYLKQYDMDGNDRISHPELTSMLDSLGSTLSQETIDGFFARFNLSPKEGEMTFEQATICLEDAVHKPMEQRKRVTTDQQVPDSTTPMLSDSPKEEANRLPSLRALDLSGPAARPPSDAAVQGEAVASMPGVDTNQYPTNKPLQVPAGPGANRSVSDQTVQTASDATPVAPNQQPASHSVPPVSTVPRSPTDLLNEDLDEAGRGSGSSSDEIVERVINIRTCPLCHRPRMNAKGERDIVTHLAVCASSDWALVDRMIVDTYVTPSQAQRKWFTKVIAKVYSGAYEIGANSANIIVQNRETGQLEEEKMQGYVKLGIRLLYKGASGRMEGARARKLLKSLSVKQGVKFDVPESAREILPFIAFHNLDTNEILDPLDSFKNFNQFFYRKLKTEARPLSEPNDPNRLVSIADCRVMLFESVDEATRIWIKGREFSVNRLLGDAYKGEASKFVGGALGIFRSAPQDYHRFHVPVDGKIGKMTFIAGEYYAVNPQAIRTSLDVYGENVRKIVPIDSPQFGRVMAVCVGAMMVGSIVTTVEEGSEVKRGDEFGYFAFGGSTIVCLFEKGTVQWDEDLLVNSKSSLETL
ncbi:hypothetical protein FRC04_007234, partial [Tulasnella sp. 424]